jgi:ribosome-associated heat shock protein Hsp15
LNKVRLDRWLWAARFYKTRGLAKAAVTGGKITLDGNKPKPAKEVNPGMEIVIRKGTSSWTIIINALSAHRGSAPVAATLYTESPLSIENREAESARRQMERQGLKIPDRKPTKRDRRKLMALRDARDTVK